MSQQEVKRQLDRLESRQVRKVAGLLRKLLDTRNTFPLFRHYTLPCSSLHYLHPSRLASLAGTFALGTIL